MLLAQELAPHRQALAVDLFGLGELVLLLQAKCQVVHDDCDADVLGTVHLRPLPPRSGSDPYTSCPSFSASRGSRSDSASLPCSCISRPRLSVADATAS